MRLHILIGLFAQAKAEVRPGVRISKPTAHYDVLSGKAISEKAMAPTQASTLVLNL